MAKKTNALKESISQFNQFNDEQRMFIRNCIDQSFSVRMSNYLLNPQQLQGYLVLLNNIVELIQQEVDKEKVVKKLIINGLEADDANLFYDFGSRIEKMTADSEIINSMSVNSFKCAINFVIEKMFLSREYSLYSLDYVTNLCDFKNKAEMAKAIGFLYSKIESISTKEISLATLKSIFEVDYLIKGDLQDAFFQCINEKLSDIYQAQLFNQLQRVLCKIDQLEDEIESIKTKEANDLVVPTPE